MGAAAEARAQVAREIDHARAGGEGTRRPLGAGAVRQRAEHERRVRQSTSSADERHVVDARSGRTRSVVPRCELAVAKASDRPGWPATRAHSSRPA